MRQKILLEMYATACRHFGRPPTRMELRLYRRANPGLPTDRTFDKRFGSRTNLLGCLLVWATANRERLDVAGMVDIDEILDGPDEPQVAQPQLRLSEGHVYLIRSGPYYKVGRSDELERRVKEIRVALPDAATLEHSIRTDDPPGIEAYWHRRFNGSRVNGEWFELAPSYVKAFKKRKFQ